MNFYEKAFKNCKPDDDLVEKTLLLMKQEEDKKNYYLVKIQMTIPKIMII